MLKNMMVSLVTLVLTLALLRDSPDPSGTQTGTEAVPPPATGIPQRAPMPTVAAPHTPLDREPPLPTHTVALPIMRKGLEKTTATNAYGGSATHTAGQGTTASNVAYGGSCLSCGRGLERRLPPTHMAVARHITREVVPSPQIHMVRRHIVHPPPTMGTIHPPPWRTTGMFASCYNWQLRFNCRCRSRVAL